MSDRSGRSDWRARREEIGRIVLELAGAVAAGALLARLLPLPPHDAFRLTLEVLPVLLAGFHLLSRWCARAGGGRLAPAGTAAELAALAALVLLVLARGRLGLPAELADQALAGGLFLVLACRAARQVAACRPLLGTALPDRPSALFFFLPLAVYLAILPWSAGHRQPDGDEPFYLLTTHSVAYDFDADLTNNYAQADWRHFMDRPIAPQPGDPVGVEGELYSRHNALLPMALAPAYRLFGKRGALATMAVFAALLAWMTLRLARHYTRGLPAESLAAYALVAFASPLLIYSYQVWVEVPAALLVALALDRVLAFSPAAPAGDPPPRAWGWREWMGFGVPVLLLPLLKIRLMLLAAPLLAMAWWRTGHAGWTGLPGRRRRTPVWVVAVLLALVGGGMLLYNDLVYANPLKIHSWRELYLHEYSPAAYFLGLSGLLYDCAFGLFGYAPIWLLLLPAGFLLLVRRGTQRSLLGHLAILSAPYLLVVIPRLEWYGGWSPPFRYALAVLPLLGIALAPLLGEGVRERPWPLALRAVIAGLGALTLALTLLWVVVPGWTYSFADGRTYLLDALAGHLGADVARFFPSSVRPRPATWIWPAVTLVLAPLVWRLRSRRGAPAVGGPAAALSGVALLLVLAATLPVAATRLATRTIELEDPQVVKTGGHLYPDRWVIERARHRGAWALRVGERSAAPVVPGGRRVRITLTAELVRNQPQPFELEIAAGDTTLTRWRLSRDRHWDRLVVEPFDWPAGAPLAISAHGPHPPGPANGALLDRADLEWMR